MYRVILVVDLNIPAAFAPKRVAVGKGDLIQKYECRCERAQ